MYNIALLFPGQGSQYVGMGKEIYNNYPIARQTFEEASDTLGFDMMKLCSNGSFEELTKTKNAQPAILTVSIAMFRIYMEKFNIKPMYCIGNSLGEITALTCAGVINYRDALIIVKNRGTTMQEAVPQGLGSMVAINGITSDIVKKICEEVSTPSNVVVVSSYSSLDQTVISGHKEAVESAESILIGIGAKTYHLNVSAPFHSPLMEVAAISFRKFLEKYEFSNFNIPVISNATASPYEGTSCIIDNLAKQITEPIQWVKSINFLIDKGVNIGLEIGPKSVLKDLVRNISLEIKSISFDNKNDLDMFSDIINGKKPIFTYDNSIVTRCLVQAVSTRNRNWNELEYQEGVIVPYKKLQQMQRHDNIGVENLRESDVETAIKLLETIFKTKMVPISEQENRIELVLKGTGYVKRISNK